MAAPLAGHAHAALSAGAEREPGSAGGVAVDRAGPRALRALCDLRALCGIRGVRCVRGFRALRSFGALRDLRVLLIAASWMVALAPFAPRALAADGASVPAQPVPAIAGHAGTAFAADPLSDAPEGERPAAAADVPPVTSYDEALARWRSAADVEAWLGRHFRYDLARALQLSETQRRRQGTLPIVEPPAFFARPSGVCVDVARFGVETLRRIDPAAQARYLMIEFDPLTLSGQTLRRHWVAMVEVGGQRYVFADSKRPGVVAGPYADTQAFVDDYARYRGRRIVAFQERASFERQARQQRRAVALPASGARGAAP